ncbi:type II secretion system F family protein [Pseudolabrys sp. FHR47]|uniref:type II secretion system F family protein n=1 Tax=Pseudolabrys sp. FHR47 TaxID=2562284 RepID=UPI0010BE5116|nr:type II secretion system F family protein [Pseudolabrys sp. FHR47]
MFDLNPVYLFYVMIGLSAAMFAEGIYLVFYNAGSYRKNINRRLKVVEANADRESVLVQLRRERGLTSAGDYRFNFFDLNRLLLQSGLSIGLGKLVLFIGLGAIGAFAGVLVLERNVGYAALAALFAIFVLPILVLKFLRARRQKMFGAQFADGLDIIVRSLRAGHPVPVAISMVAREMPDPIGSEFGIVGDEITYGADLETAMRNLYFRVGTDDLPLFVTAVAIQTSTGGNLGEILENLSGVIRQRFKMRRKVKALAAEGRASALILSSLPVLMFFVIQLMVPDFYASVWHQPMTKIGLAAAGFWMGVGNLIMFRMVNFRI